MDTARKIGIAIVMMVPAFVGAGAVWDLLQSWFAVFIWVAVMAAVTVSILTGKLLSSRNEQEQGLAHVLKGH